MRLTDKSAAALRGKPKTYKVTDDRCPGLTLRVHPGGTKAWYIRKTLDMDGTKRRVELKIGNFPAMNCTKARIEFHQQTAVVEEGLAHAVSAARSRATGLEMGELLAMYADDLALTVKPKTLRSYRATINGISDLPLHSMLCTGLTRHRVKDWFRSLVGAGYSRGYCRVIVRLHAAAIQWACDEGLINTPNHFKALMRREVRRMRPAPRRDRVLTDDELRAVWYFDGFVKNRPKWLEVSTILRLLVLTGLRSSEIVGLEWADVGAGEQHVPEMGQAFPLIIIPAERTKTRTAYSVPLLDPINAVLADYSARLRGTKRAGKVFPLMSATASTAVLASIQREGATHTIHDIRRTVSTRLSAAGVPREWIQAVLQHTTRGNASDHYIHHAFIGQKVQALGKWFELLAPVLNAPPALLAGPADKVPVP